MAKFYRKRFEKEVGKAVDSRGVRQKARQVALEIVDIAHREMMENFDDHPVTKELQSGPAAENTSGTLGGYGNLFSFIGFPAGHSPTRPIRKYLRKSGRVAMQPVVRGKHKDMVMAFKVEAPTIPVIEALSPSPWEGKSWARGIERGISGFGNYMYSKSPGFGDQSRSRKAVQSSKTLRGMAYRPIQYMTSILEKFYKKIR